MTTTTKGHEKYIGPSPQEWLDMMFEFENCHECGRGARSHIAVPMLGNWFAYCKPVKHRARKAGQS